MRYYKPGTDTKQSLFTPLPLEWMALKANTEQTGFDTANSTLGAAGDALNLKSLMSQDKTRQEQLAKYHEQINKTVDELNNTGNWKGIMPKVTGIQQSWNADPINKMLEYNLEQKTLHDKDIAEMKKKGKDVYQEYNDAADLNWKAYNDDGSLNIYNYNGINAGEDKVASARAIVGDIKNSGYDTTNEKLNSGLGLWVTTHNKSVGVGDSKLWGIATTLADDWLKEDPGGKDWFREYTYYNPDTWNAPIYEDEVDASGNKTGKKVITGHNYQVDAIKFIHDVNKAKVGIETGGGTTYDEMSEYYSKKITTDEGGPVSPGRAVVVPKKKINPNKDLTPSNTKPFSQFVEGKPQQGQFPKINYPAKTEGEDRRGISYFDNLSDADKASYRDIVRKNLLNTTTFDNLTKYKTLEEYYNAVGVKAGLTFDQFADQVENYIGQLKTAADNTTEDITDQIQVGGMSPTEKDDFYNYAFAGTKATGTPLTLTDLLGLYSTSPVQIKENGQVYSSLQDYITKNKNGEKKAELTGKITNSDNLIGTLAEINNGSFTNRFARGFSVSIATDKGEVETLYIGGPESFTSVEKQVDLQKAVTANTIANWMIPNGVVDKYVNMGTVIGTAMEDGKLKSNDVYISPDYYDGLEIKYNKSLKNWSVKDKGTGKEMDGFNSVEQIINAVSK